MIQAREGVGVRANGVVLHVEESGAGAPILGVHGGGSTAAFWRDAARAWARRGRAIVYDRRGCGRSERPEPYATDVHQQADDAAALVAALDAAPAIVVGRSYGGAIALDLALRYPELVRAVVQLEGDGVVLGEAGRRELAELEALAAGAPPGEAAEAVVRRVAGDAAWEALPQSARQILEDNGPALVAELRGGLPAVTAARLRTVRAPTLLVGARDSLLDYGEAIERTAAALPHARVAWVDGGHLVDPAHPVVLAFVDELLGLSRR